jgi:hypothetical protein
MNQEYAASRPHLPDPASAPELFDGVLTRRVLAYFIDLAIMGALVLALTIVGAIVGVLGSPRWSSSSRRRSCSIMAQHWVHRAGRPSACRQWISC